MMLLMVRKGCTTLASLSASSFSSIRLGGDTSSTVGTELTVEGATNGDPDGGIGVPAGELA